MHVIAKPVLDRFWQSHADAADDLRAWYAEASRAEWRKPAEILANYPKASLLADNRVVFDIGRQYRLVVRVNHRSLTVFVRFVGTHGQYDRIDARAI